MKTLRVFSIVLFVLALAISQVQAANLSVFVSCVVHDESGSLTIQLGYEADTALTSGGVGYISNSIDIYADSVGQGRNELAALAVLQPGDTPMMFFMDGFAGDEYIYGDVWVDFDTDAPECGDDTQVSNEPPVLDDAGVVNNPQVNERANTCYNPGQVCLTAEDWIAGWYLIRR